MKKIKFGAFLFLIVFLLLLCSCTFVQDKDANIIDPIEKDNNAHTPTVDDNVQTVKVSAVIFYYDIAEDKRLKLTTELEIAGELTYDNVLTLLSKKYGVQIGYHQITFDKGSLHLDFDTMFAPFSGTGSTSEAAILDSVAQSLLFNFPQIEEVYFSADSQAYSSGHFILPFLEPFMTRTQFENPEEYNLSKYEEEITFEDVGSVK